MKRIPIWAVTAGVVLAGALAAGGLAVWNAQRAKTPTFVTAPVTVGTVSREITASGTVNPVVNVQVGAFVSGTIQALYCDYNTRVSQGQLCAKIDPKPYETVVAKAQADLDAQRAQLGKDQAALALAELRLGRSRTLQAQGWNSRDTLDGVLAIRDQARAQTALDQAQIRQSQAALHAAQINLAYTDIVSPVDGTVVSRNVNVGQTVASSFQTPTLFLIAKDLTKMQVDTNVSESDIAGAAAGAAASFSVEAYPGHVFAGQVAQVRQAPVSVQNVITYDVVVTADNPDLLLKPGMTATAKIVVARRENVLRVPDQALRFSPSAGARPKGAAAGGRPAVGTRRRAASGGGGAPQRVWILKDGKPVRVPVTVGLDDDANAEITAGAVKAGDLVIVTESRKDQTSASPAPARQALRFGP